MVVTTEVLELEKNDLRMKLNTEKWVKFALENRDVLQAVLIPVGAQNADVPVQIVLGHIGHRHASVVKVHRHFLALQKLRREIRLAFR